MGVTGLWRLIEPAGKPVPVETLENKVLAVDISIWLHQMVKGYQDAKGAPLPNAHLMGLFQRLCKLLYFRIKPVFVFDGAFPELKKETIAKRQDSKAKYNSESERLKRELVLLLGKKTAVSSLLGKQISPKKGNAPTADIDDLFKLPALPVSNNESESESEDDSNESIIDMHSVDVESENFKSLPVKDKYNLLLDLKETRKMNSWGRLHELPKKSDNFSDFQMQRLLKRRKVQECLQETEKEMGDAGMSLNELESLLNEEGIDTKIDTLPTRRIASDNTTRILMINNVKEALEQAKKRKEAQENPKNTNEDEQNKMGEIIGEKNELEKDINKAIQMSLECVNAADTSVGTSKTDDSWTSVLTDSDYTDSEDNDGYEVPDMSSAKAYIMQYSDFTPNAINAIIVPKNKGKGKSKISKADKIIDELNKEKSVVVDKIELSSEDEEIQNLTEEGNKVIDDDNPSSIDPNSTHEDLDLSIVDTEQATVVSFETPEQDVITLDTSTEEEVKRGCLITATNKITKVESSQSESDDDEPEEVPVTESQFIKPVDLDFSNVDATQASVVYVETPVQDVITLDTSMEEEMTQDCLITKTNKNTKESSQSESDDDEFEEVPVTESQFIKPVVQITVNVGECPEKDDIFADIFSNIHESNRINQKIESDSASTSTMSANNKIETSNLSIDIIKDENFFQHNTDRLTEKSNVRFYSAKEVEKGLHLEEYIPVTQKIIVKPSTNSSGVKVNLASINNLSTTVIDEDDELQKAIQMSLESGEDDTTPLSKAKTPLPPKQSLTTEKLNSMAAEIQNEEQDLIQEKGRLDRIGRNITEQMTKEAQELLQIFGIPYIVAPMEAEAQCAFLESVNLTDGTITDDSDIWLFGGRTVYKNFFNQKKHVLQFLAERIERSFNLTREQLVLLALLVGSDYTTGVTGVGPVTALEILASFPFNKKQLLNETSIQARYAHIVSGLQEFKKWMRAGKRTDNTTLKKKLKNVDLTDDFPSVRVAQAYMEPNVEKSEEKFSWGEIDITILRDYAKAKFGWSQNKLDEIVKPVIKRLVDRKSQKSIQDYFKRKVELQSLDEQMSKRVKAAVQKMAPDGSSIEEQADQKIAKPSGKRKVNKMSEENAAMASKTKRKKTDEVDVLKNQGVTVVSQVEDGKSSIEINIPKSDRYQEIIPQREKDKQGLLQNKMKAIEIFRKTKMDKKRRPVKRRANVPKEKAELSESSDSD